MKSPEHRLTGRGSVPVRSLQNWAEHQGENKTIFLPPHTTPVSVCVSVSPPKPTYAGCYIEVLDVCSLNLEWMIKAGSKGFGRGKGAQTQSFALSHAAYQPHTDPLGLHGSQRCSQTQTNPRSTALHKEYFGTNHHNNAHISKISFQH